MDFLRENPHLEPRFPDGGWVLGWEQFFFCAPWFCLDVVAAPLRRGVGPTLSPCGQVVVTKDYRVLVRGWWVWRSFVWIEVSVRCVGGCYFWIPMAE